MSDSAWGAFQVLLFFGLIMFFFAMIPATIAASKGRNMWVWLLYGFFFWLIALIHSIVMAARRCPDCAGRIRLEAKVCRHCQCDLASADSGAQRRPGLMLEGQ